MPTGADPDRSVDFYSRVLTFPVVSDVEATGDDVARLPGVLGLRLRVVRMRLDDGQIELTESLAPRGRAVAPRSVAFAGPTLGFRAGTMVRDPDGHALRVLAH
jgi:catechol 2,3-dioxygenase-like lactoylglutathione lyase family enzyme